MRERKLHVEAGEDLEFGADPIMPRRLLWLVE